VLAARPVSARPPSTLYQLRLFARRRRGLVSALAAVAAVVLVSLVALSLQNLELGRRGRLLGEQNTELGRREALLAHQNEELGRRERLATRVAKFARDFLAESDVMRARGVDYTVREALDEAAATLDAEAFPDARTEAELRQLVGETYRGLALPAVAEPHLRRAIERWEQAAGAAHPSTIRARLGLVLTLRELDRNPDAERLLAELEQLERQGERDERLALELQHMRAMLLRDAGRLRDAEQEYRDVLAARERVLGPDAEATLATMHNLGTLLLSMQRPADARDVLQQCLERSERSGHGRTATWQVADNLAEAWRELGDLERAAATHRQAMAGYTELLGADHALTLGCGYHLLKVLRQQGDFAALRDLAAELVPRCERTFGREHRRTMHVLAAHAVGLMNCGDATAACALFERAYGVQLRDLGPAHPDTFTAGNNLVGGRLAAGDAAGALAVSTDLVGRLQPPPELPPGLVPSLWLSHARALAAAGRTDEARRAASTARTLAVDALPSGHPLVGALDELLAKLAAAAR
jgi:tetratricopeptide (TPR) repeat protein